MVLATAVGRTEAREGTDFFPLTVDIEEKMYAAGKIPGGFFKREGRASEKATLNARMVDRPIRPLWPKGFRNEVQVIGTVLSADRVAAHDILAINGASAALVLSPLPFFGPIGAVRVGLIEGELVVNPTMPDMDDSTLDLIVCGTADAITMVEAGAEQVAEDVLLEALELAHEEIRKLCAAQLELQARPASRSGTTRPSRTSSTQRYGARFDAAIAEHGLAGVAVAENEILADELPPVAPDAGEDVMVRRTQVRIAACASSPTRAAPRPSRRRRGAVRRRDPRACPTPSRTPRSSSRPSARRWSSAIVAGVQLPFPGGAEAASSTPLTAARL